jgi:hypothetical protein
MKGALTAEFSESDILFLIETADPALLSKIETIKDDPDIIEGMMEHEASRLFSADNAHERRDNNDHNYPKVPIRDIAQSRPQGA